MLIERLKNDEKAIIHLNDVQKSMKDQVDHKVKNNVYCFERLDFCPVCNSQESTLIGEKDRYGLKYPVVICKDCGLLYTNPRMSQQSYDDFYNVEYRKLYMGHKRANNTYFQMQYRHGQKIHEHLFNKNIIEKRAMKIFEVGCGGGGILSFFKDKGHIVEGIDLGEEYINYGKNEKKLNLSCSKLEDYVLQNKPDIIIYSHVLEHVLDINAELNFIKNISDLNTIIYIEVPGFKNLNNNYKGDILRYFQNAHTFHFSLKTLKNLFSKHEFKLLSGDEFVRSIFKLDNSTSNHKLDSDYDSAIDYIFAQEKSRKFYNFKWMGLKHNLKQLLIKTLR